MIKNIILIVSSLGAGLILFQFLHVFQTRDSADAPAAKRMTSGQVTVRASGRGAPWINLSDGRDVITAYAGAAGLDQVLEQNQAQPLALASADFDEDRVADLISGHAHAGGGLLTLHRSNVDSIFPRNPGARQRRDQAITSGDSQAPFLSPARVFETAEAPQLIGAGDFNNDGHRDVVAAAMASDALYLLAGDGRGGLGQTERIGLPGRVTALVTGEINRADGSADVVVGIIGAEGPQVLVFESHDGALRGAPEVFALPAEAKALALSQFDGDSLGDLAVAAGHDLVVAHGRDRKLLLEETRRAEVPLPKISVRSCPFAIALMAAGDFTGDHRTELALMSDDGAIHLLGQGRQKDEGIEGWSVETLTTGRWPLATGLVCAGVSSIPKDDLVVVDRAGGQLHILTSDPPAGSSDKEVIAASPHPRVSASLDVEDGAVAAMPMRLNDDAQSDLVILRSGQIAPAVVFTVAAATFTVTNTNNSGAGSLRQAIIDANNNPGSDRIEFRIGSGEKTINLLSELPHITSAPVYIDGTTQPSGTSGLGCLEQKGHPCIELNGANAGPVNGGLVILAGGTVVRGLAINRFKGSGIYLADGSGNLLIGNHIGVDMTGTVALGNEGRGVWVRFTPNNVIGFGGPENGNVISGNGFGNTASPLPGIEIWSDAGNHATGTIIQGNYIGADSSGAAALPNASHGVFVYGGSNSIIGGIGSRNVISGNNIAASNDNIVGGTTPEARNVISGDGTGVRIGDGAANNQVQGNFIGTDARGGARASVIDVGNTTVGVNVADSPNNTIGGVAEGARNIISGNKQHGILISGGGATESKVQGNYIGLNVTGAVRLANAINGLQIENGASGATIGGATAGARNVISGNGLSGVAISGAGTMGNRVQGNFIGTDVNGAVDLGNNSNGVLINDARGNTIGGTTNFERNVISGNNGRGIEILGSGATMNQVLGNFIGVNAAGIADLGNSGSGVSISGASGNIIGGTATGARNVISGNDGQGVDLRGNGNVVQGNFIGTDVTGAAALGNSIIGVSILNGSNNAIGGVAANAGNIIAFNGNGGVVLTAPDPISVTGNAILSNSIFSNTGPVLPDMGLGIDLGETGVTPNDATDADPGANNLQNFPVLTSIITGGNTTIQGTLNSAANTAFRLEFFSNAACDPSGHGEGQSFIGSTMVTTNASGAASFNVAFQTSVGAGQFFTATATDPNNNTSEFCQCRQAVNPVASVSAASFSGTALATESIVAAFGAGLATSTQSAETLPLPTSLAGTTVKVKDSAGSERLAPLFFVAPAQVNYQMPPGTAAGLVNIAITSGNGTVSVGQAQITVVAPGLFAANADGQGVAAAIALRVKADGAQSYEPVSRYDSGQNKFVAVPIDLDPEGDQVFLILFGTGIRFRSSLTGVMATIGGAGAQVLFADAQGGFVGLDQINAHIPRSLIGRSEVDMVLTVDGRVANNVKVNIK